MKVLGISGSPRKDGNTALLVKKAIEFCEREGVSVSFISLSEKRIEHCRGCRACIKPPYKCAQEDDVSEILEEMKSADAILVGSPTYFSSVSGKLKSLFDRTLPLRADNYRLSGKVGGAIAVGGSRNGGQELVCMNIHNWMLLHEMVVVSDKETAHFGGIGVGRNPGDVLKDDVGIKTTENLARSLLDFIIK
ncbi:MAG: flavodoxin family protein [Candidatus Altiarchaeota archaeon]|nr:flavodoxin family protein [Candidatus Altiarchaeota archaeon]